MWILNRLEIALQRADLMFGSIAEDGSLGRVRTSGYAQHPGTESGVVGSCATIRIVISTLGCPTDMHGAYSIDKKGRGVGVTIPGIGWWSANS